MTKRKKILVLTPRYPYPVIGGDRLRIYEVCRVLAKEHELTLLSLCETLEELHAPVPEDQVFTHIERIFLPKWRSVINVLAALPTAEPLQIAYYRSDAFAERIQTLSPNHDICLAHLIRTGNYVRKSSLPVVLEMTDAISMNYKRMPKVSARRELRSLAYRVEAIRLLKYELNVFNDFSLVSLISNIDRNFLLRGRNFENAVVTTNGVDLKLFPFQERLNSKPVAAFIGNITSFQNLDACYYFAEEVLPLVRKNIDCRFKIVGRIKPTDARRLAAIDGVEVSGSIPTVSDAVIDARVGIAPIRIGAGVQNKVLEYMALGLPVIASRVATEGLHLKEGRDVLVASTPAEYAEKLVLLWRDNSLRAELSRAGYEYVRSQHSWQQCLQPLVDKINSLA